MTGNPKAAITADEVPADLILISHGHGDHVGDAVAIARRTGAAVATNYEIGEWLKQLDAAHVPEAATAMLAALGGLLTTFIGDGLTLRLLRKAWPDGFSDSAA